MLNKNSNFLELVGPFPPDKIIILVGIIYFYLCSVKNIKLNKYINNNTIKLLLFHNIIIVFSIYELLSLYFNIYKNKVF